MRARQDSGLYEQSRELKPRSVVRARVRMMPTVSTKGRVCKAQSSVLGEGEMCALWEKSTSASVHPGCWLEHWIWHESKGAQLPHGPDSSNLVFRPGCVSVVSCVSTSQLTLLCKSLVCLRYAMLCSVQRAVGGVAAVRRHVGGGWEAERTRNRSGGGGGGVCFRFGRRY